MSNANVVDNKHLVEGLPHHLEEQVGYRHDYETQVVAGIALRPAALRGFPEPAVVGGGFRFAPVAHVLRAACHCRKE